MKNKIIKIIFPILLSIILGAVSGKIVSKIYAEKTTDTLNSVALYIIEEGTYNDESNLRLTGNTIDYAYYKEDDKYKKIIGITQDEENVAKIINTYNIDGEVSKYLLTNKEIASKITTYDILLKTATSEDEIKQMSIFDSLDAEQKDYQIDNLITLINKEVGSNLLKRGIKTENANNGDNHTNFDKFSKSWVENRNSKNKTN